MEKRIELEKRGRKPSEIKELVLDDCHSTSIVGLTDEFVALETLSLISVGLTSLKGFPKLPNLKKLELSDNRISGGLNILNSSSPMLTTLNLSGNKITDFEAFRPLQELKYLTNLDLFNNDATSIECYRQKIFILLPNLEVLDGIDKSDDESEEEYDEFNRYSDAESDEDSDEVSEEEEDEDEEEVLENKNHQYEHEASEFTVECEEEEDDYGVIDDDEEYYNEYDDDIEAEWVYKQLEQGTKRKLEEIEEPEN